MTTAAKGSFGAKLYIQKTDGTTWVQVGEIGEFGISGQERGTEDATSHESPGGWGEKIATGVIEAGTITGKYNAVETNGGQLEMHAAWSDGLARNFRVVTSQGDKRRAGAGIVTLLNENRPVRGKREVDFTIECTGQWVLEAHP